MISDLSGPEIERLNTPVRLLKAIKRDVTKNAPIVDGAAQKDAFNTGVSI